jgi:CTP:molybdopterin cytidylyltransferase MocA
MLGSEGASPAERWVAGGRRAALLDVVALAASQPGVGRIVVATAEADFARAHAALPVTWDLDPPGQPFHFGRRLAALLERYPGEVHAYLGAGSVPLLPPAVLAEALAEVGAAGDPYAVTNNLYSSDWMVWNCAAAVCARPDRLPNDNALGWVLQSEAGLRVRSLPANAATRLDIDTPADLLLLGLHPAAGEAVAAYLAEGTLGAGNWLAAGRRLAAPAGQVALIGRVGAAVWQYVEAHTQAWVRVFSEERGMTASGRLAAGRVRSLVAAHLLRVGPRDFFAELSELVEAAFFDTRVVLAHAGRWPSAADRYAADLGRVDEIVDPFLRELAAAAWTAPIPVVLGGHGVVAGDLYGLIEIASAGRLGPALPTG